MSSKGGTFSPMNVTTPSNDTSCGADSEFRYLLFTIFYSFIFILGFIANCYVLWIFCHVYAWRKLNEIKIFMVNLIVADLLFLITLPLWIVYYHNNGNWIMPPFLCNVAGYLFFVNTYCSIAFLTVITYNRFQAVTKPITAAQFPTRRRGIFLSAAIWVVIMSSALYYLAKDGINEINHGTIKRCFEGYNTSTSDNNVPILASHVVIFIIFVFIFLFILVCNLFIIKTLLTKSVQLQKSTHVKQRAFRMVCTVLAVFIICFVPHHLVELPWTLTVLELWQKENCPLRQQLNDAHQVMLCLLSTNCMLDPVIYCFLTKKFRKHLSENLKSMKGSRKCSRQTTETVIEGTVPINDLPTTPMRNEYSPISY
ncbi:platelet-activating factor receptor [Malaclemys terrapin pileata]|uniref:platelet-activating factor receptor n=1 Tax=Malaclemys terrapin pileata TaxID=2991368 RepID=UPI0023A7EEBE|nr:platelet-activating factor receptor [Malaclemys terrapin pileata]